MSGGRIFPGVRPPSIDFQAVRDGRRARPLYFEISLAAARSIANGITNDQNDTSGKALQLNVAGNAFYCDPIYDSAGTFIAGVAVSHFEDSALGAGISTPLTLLPNSSHRIPFTSVFIENAAQAGKKLRVIYGVDLDFTPGFNAQLLGSVALDEATMDQLRFCDDDVRDGEAFSGPAVSGPVAAQLAQSQLFNPAASGRFVYVDRISFTELTATNRFNIRLHNAALVGLLGQAANLNAGGAASLGQLRGGAAAASSGTKIFDQASLVNTVEEVIFIPPIRLPEGFGVHTEAGAVNTSTATTFRFREKTA